MKPLSLLPIQLFRKQPTIPLLMMWLYQVNKRNSFFSSSHNGLLYLIPFLSKAGTCSNCWHSQYETPGPSIYSRVRNHIIVQHKE
jgi:hypothetical protein